MKSFVLDAAKIEPGLNAVQFFQQFYHLKDETIASIKRTLFAMEETMITEVFNWPADHPAWKEISLVLESIQQHSPNFYVIWGPETINARDYLLTREEEDSKAELTEPADPKTADFSKMTAECKVPE